MQDDQEDQQHEKFVVWGIPVHVNTQLDAKHPRKISRGTELPRDI